MVARNLAHNFENKRESLVLEKRCSLPQKANFDLRNFESIVGEIVVFAPQQNLRSQANLQIFETRLSEGFWR